jgi:hypothetical protein
MPLPFCVGAPATITIGQYGPHNHGLGYAFYAVIQEIIVTRSLHITRCTQVIAEVHVVPGHIMDWVFVGAQLWAEPPAHVQFVQLHTFLLPFYKSLSYSYVDLTMIKTTLDSIAMEQWVIDCDIPEEELYPCHVCFVTLCYV